MLKSTYRRGGEAVLVALGCEEAEGKLFCDLLSAGNLPDKAFTLKGEDASGAGLSVKVRVPSNILLPGPHLACGLELEIL